MPMGIFLGIDGGGTQTSCLIGDEQSVLGFGKSGASNLIRVGEAEARKALAAAIGEACHAANINPTQINRGCVGIAGAARPEVADTNRRSVGEILPGRIQIFGDMVIWVYS